MFVYASVQTIHRFTLSHFCHCLSRSLALSLSLPSPDNFTRCQQVPPFPLPAWLVSVAESSCYAYAPLVDPKKRTAVTAGTEVKSQSPARAARPASPSHGDVDRQDAGVVGLSGWVPPRYFNCRCPKTCTCWSLFAESYQFIRMIVLRQCLANIGAPGFVVTGLQRTARMPAELQQGAWST